jgi:subtilisin family serine protease
MLQPLRPDASKENLMTSLRLILLALVFLSGLSGRALAFEQVNQPRGPVPGRYIVKLSERADVNRLSQSLSKDERLSPVTSVPRAELQGADTWQYYYVYQHQSKSLSEAEVISVFGKENVEFVEQDYYLEWYAWPSDDLFDQQWYLYNTGQSYLGIDRISGSFNDTLAIKSGVAGEDINTSPLYDSPPVDATRVVVAIIDTGVDVLHPELEGAIWRNPGEIPGNGIDDDHNGLVDDTLGWDFSGDSADVFNPQPDNDPTDAVGHGTHIAGIVAAQPDGTGIVGIAPNAEIMAIKMFPNGLASIGAAGIVYAVSSGANVINLSWGSPFQSRILEEALGFARRNGVFVEVASGNTGQDERFYPAAIASAFTVGASNSSGEVTYFSTFGDHIDIVAPGLDILSLRAAGTDMYADSYEPGVRIIGSDSLYYLADGTSMAAPMVAGAAARIWAIRPDLSLETLENILRWGARDIVDPFGRGEDFPGPDSVSGWGFLDLHAALQLAGEGGAFIAEPIRRNRYTGDVPIKVAPVAGYDGGWALFMAPYESLDWQQIAAGESMPDDSVAYVFTLGDPEGSVRLRLTDDLGGEHITSFVHVRTRRVEITTPAQGAELRFNVGTAAYCYGPDFDSLTLSLGRMGAGSRRVFGSTGEFFDSLLYNHAVSASDTGEMILSLTGFFGGDTVADSVTVNVLSAFSAGWPQRLIGRGAVTPAMADLDNDGFNEIVLGTSAGVQVWTVQGGNVMTQPGFPVGSGEDFQCVPAIYDIDGDGFKEIIATSATGIHAFKYDGSYAAGWPVACTTGRMPYNYGYPTPVIVGLDHQRDSAIAIINKLGEVLAYRFSGEPYFFSLEGQFAMVNPRISRSWLHGGSSAQVLTADDLDGDGENELVAEYTSMRPYYGLTVFEGRTGRPKFHPTDAVVERIPQAYGFTLADLDGDGLSEVIGLGYDSSFAPFLYVKTMGNQDFPGWPKRIPACDGFIGSYPVVEDLNLDGIPEILVTFFEFDIAYLYIFNADGTPYVERPGRPEGEVLSAGVTLSTPAVANLVGDEYPEIAIRSGYILPGTGTEKLFLLDYMGEPVPGWPIETPAPRSSVFSSRQVPLVADIDGDGLVELALVSDGGQLLVWDFETSSEDGANSTRFLRDNRNSSILPSLPRPLHPPGLPPGPAQIASATQERDDQLRLVRCRHDVRDTIEAVGMVPSPGRVRLEVVDDTGLVSRSHTREVDYAGTHTFVVSAAELPDGMYTLRLRLGRTMVSQAVEVRR